jgi:gamma-glutamylcysteine synthetase
MRNRDAAWLRYISTQDERVLLALYALELTLLNEKAMIEASNYVDLANEIEAEIHNMAAGKVFRAATNLKFRNKSLISDDRYASCPAGN